ncbi:MAG: GtrA family protein [Oceanicaulis sp.]|nr:GtrA family protein [Oceanicaulis sp.]
MSSNTGKHASLSAYETMDFSENSDLRKQLLARVQDEAGSAEIRLSDPLSYDSPSYLTQEMLSWYRTSVNPVRQAALTDIAEEFQALGKSNQTDGIFIERERQRLSISLGRKKRDIYREQREQKKLALDKIQSLKKEEDRLTNEYNTIRAREGNREPKVTNTPLYVFLLLIVGVVEVLINFDSFNTLSWSTPFLALGLSVVVAIALALASHWHGTVLRQWNYYFGKRERDENRWAAWRMLALGSLALSVVLASVAYARVSFLADYILLNQQLGGTDRTSSFMMIAGTLLGNVLVWIVGIFIAWLMHDRNPEFPEKRKALNKVAAQISDLSNNLERERRRELQRAEAEFADELEKLENAERAQKAASSYGAARAAFQKFSVQDGRVLAALAAYRAALIRKASKTETKLLVPHMDDETVFRSCDVSEYERHDIELKLC